MAYSPIGNLTNGNVLQILYSEGVYSQLSEDYRDFEQVKIFREGDFTGKQFNYTILTGRGPAGTQYRNPNGSTAFPAAQDLSTAENTAYCKEIETTLEIDYNLYLKLKQSPNERYVDLFGLKVDTSVTNQRRRLAADWMGGDGTGVIMEAASAADDTTNDQVVVTLATDDAAVGGVGMAEFDDLLLAYGSNGTATSPTMAAGTFYAWKVTGKDRRANTVTLKPVDSSGALLGLTSSDINDGDFFYRVGQPSIPNRGSISDYGTASEAIVGLESLCPIDTRTVHGVARSGATASTKVNCQGATLDWTYFQQAMDDVKDTVGKGKYTWKKAAMASSVHAALIEEHQTDRRFHIVEDNKRGLRYWAFQHEADVIEAYTSEFAPKNRIRILPEAKDGRKVFEMYGTDFKPVQAEGENNVWRLKPSANGGHERKMVAYFHGDAEIVCTHMPAVPVIHNFSV